MEIGTPLIYRICVVCGIGIESGKKWLGMILQLLYLFPPRTMTLSRWYNWGNLAELTCFGVLQYGE
jgi:hypothetical protein